MIAKKKSEIQTLGAFTNLFHAYMLSRFLLVHGNWGDWTGFEQCNTTCGGGKQRRSRVCDSPSPVNGGEECLLINGGGKRDTVEDHVVGCNSQKCPSKNHNTYLFS